MTDSTLIATEEEIMTEDHEDLDAPMDAAELRESVKERAKWIDQQYVSLGHDLYEIANRKLYRDWGHATFADYVQKEIGIGKRRAQRLRQIYKRLVKDFELPVSMVSGCRYSNLMTIMGLDKPKILNKATAREWVSRAQVLTYYELIKEVERAKEMREEAPEDESDITPTRVAGAAEIERVTGRTSRKSFQLTEEEADLIDEAISEASTDGGSDRPGHVLTNICTYYLANRASDTAMKDYILSKLTSIFGGRFIHLTDPEEIEAFEESISYLDEDDGE